MSFEFVNQLTESALIRGEEGFKKFSAREVSECIFLYFMAMNILRNEKSGKEFASKYCMKTIEFQSIDSFRTTGTDLYLLMYVLFGKNNKDNFDRLHGSDNEVFAKTLNFNWVVARKFLQNIANNHGVGSQDKQFLETMLKVSASKFKSIRRMVVEWSDLKHDEKQIIMTNILSMFRSHLPQSDILKTLEKVAKENRLDISNEANAEKESLIGKLIKGIVIGSSLAAVGKALLKIKKDD